MVWGTAVWAVRDGPDGPRVSQAPVTINAESNQLLRRFATTAASSTSETRLPPNGQKTFIATTFQSVDLARSTAVFYVEFSIGRESYLAICWTSLLDIAYCFATGPYHVESLVIGEELSRKFLQ